MKMELKMENEQAVLQDGKPVYVMEDGKDFVADVPSLYGKTLELKGEAKRNREKAEAAEGLVANYKSLFPDLDADGIKDWKTQADEALTTVQNLKDKELIAAGKVEEVKKELKDAHDKNLDRVKLQFKEKETGYMESMARKDAHIFKLTIGNAFANSRFFSGKNPVTTMLPDAALALFGPNFKVEERKSDGELQIIGMYNGAEILSKQPDMVGEIAPVEEAIEYLIDRYPNKERIMDTGRAGSGAGGGQGGGAGGTDELSKLLEQYAQAQKDGDGRLAISLKTRIHKLQQAQRNRAA